MIALTANDQGHREIVGMQAYSYEFEETWTDFLSGLKKRGLSNVLIIT